MYKWKWSMCIGKEGEVHNRVSKRKENKNIKQSHTTRKVMIRSANDGKRNLQLNKPLYRILQDVNLLPVSGLGFSGSGAGSWSPVGRIQGIGTARSRLRKRSVFGSADIRWREFRNSSTTGEDRNGCTSTVMVDNVDVGGWLCTRITAVGLSI